MAIDSNNCIRIAYVDFWDNLDEENFLFTKILRKKYEVEVVKDNPDYVFCSNFGNKYLNYDCPRIYFTGEPACPDFNLYDYAIGFERMIYEDRYIRYPLYLMNRELLDDAMQKHMKDMSYYTNRTGFCSFVVSASGGLGDLRNWYFDKLSEYKQVTSGGKFRNNLPDGQPVPDKKKFQENYKFSLCFENAGISGYATEKLIDAFAAGCIPIYYGDTNIEKDFNPKAFIHVRGKEDLDNVLSQIRKIDEDEECYLSMIKEPAILESSAMLKMMEEPYLEEFLYNIVEQASENAIRRQAKLTMWGHFYEYRLKKWIKNDNRFIIRTARRWKRKLFGLKKIV